MLYRSSIGATALAAALGAMAPPLPRRDDAKYPNLKGQWNTAEPARLVRSRQAAGPRDSRRH